MITTEKIYDAIAKSPRDEKFHRWLGASLVGHDCDFFIAAQFRCAFDPGFPPRILRVFDNGHAAESRMIADLKKLPGVTLEAYQPEYPLPGALGHSGATLDGIVNDNGERKLLEMKTSNDAEFKKLQKDGIRKAKPRHYAQVQFGMLCTGLKTALYLVEDKDTNELYAEDGIAFDPAFAKTLSDKALAIVRDAQHTPLKLNENPLWWQCRCCSAAGICHGNRFPRMHCLTCCYATPVDGAMWRCDLYKANIPNDSLATGCRNHVFLPWLVNMPVLDGGNGHVIYDAGKYLGQGKAIANVTDNDPFPDIKIDTKFEIVAMRNSAELAGQAFEDCHD